MFEEHLTKQELEFFETLPKLVYQNMEDGGKKYYYINTTAEREANYLYQMYHERDLKENGKTCNCPICKGEVRF